MLVSSNIRYRISCNSGVKSLLAAMENIIKINLIFMMTILLIIGCEDKKVEDSPQWVQDILARTVNNDDLVGSWTYTSVTSYDNSDCSGGGETVDYNGSVTYEESDAIRSEEIVLLWTDFEAKGYNEAEFQEMCADKDGVINENGDCEIADEYTFVYFLNDDGYCEVISFDGKENGETFEKTFCGEVSIMDESAEITFTWSSEEWDKSGCKAIVLTEE